MGAAPRDTIGVGQGALPLRSVSSGPSRRAWRGFFLFFFSLLSIGRCSALARAPSLSQLPRSFCKASSAAVFSLSPLSLGSNASDFRSEFLSPLPPLSAGVTSLSATLLASSMSFVLPSCSWRPSPSSGDLCLPAGCPGSASPSLSPSRLLLVREEGEPRRRADPAVARCPRRLPTDSRLTATSLLCASTRASFASRCLPAQPSPSCPRPPSSAVSAGCAPPQPSSVSTFAFPSSPANSCRCMHPASPTQLLPRSRTMLDAVAAATQAETRETETEKRRLPLLPAFPPETPVSETPSTEGSSSERRRGRQGETPSEDPLVGIRELFEKLREKERRRRVHARTVASLPRSLRQRKLDRIQGYLPNRYQHHRNPHVRRGVLRCFPPTRMHRVSRTDSATEKTGENREETDPEQDERSEREEAEHESEKITFNPMDDPEVEAPPPLSAFAWPPGCYLRIEYSANRADDADETGRRLLAALKAAGSRYLFSLPARLPLVRRRFSVPKSPHKHRKAVEQFEICERRRIIDVHRRDYLAEAERRGDRGPSRWGKMPWPSREGAEEEERDDEQEREAEEEGEEGGARGQGKEEDGRKLKKRRRTDVTEEAAVKGLLTVDLPDLVRYDLRYEPYRRPLKAKAIYARMQYREQWTSKYFEYLQNREPLQRADEPSAKRLAAVSAPNEVFWRFFDGSGRPEKHAWQRPLRALRARASAPRCAASRQASKEGEEEKEEGRRREKEETCWEEEVPPSCVFASLPAGISYSGSSAASSPACSAPRKLLSAGIDLQSTSGAPRKPSEYEDSFENFVSPAIAPEEIRKQQLDKSKPAEVSSVSAGLGGNTAASVAAHEKSEGGREKVDDSRVFTHDERSKCARTEREECGNSAFLENASFAAHARCKRRRRGEQDAPRGGSGTGKKPTVSRPASEGREKADEAKNACNADGRERGAVSSPDDENEERQTASICASTGPSSFAASSLFPFAIPGASVEGFIVNEGKAVKKVTELSERGKEKAGGDAGAVEKGKEETEPEGGNQGGKDTDGREVDEEMLFEFDEDDLWLLLYERQRQESDGRCPPVAVDSTESDSFPAETQLSEELKAVVTDALAKRIVYSEKYQDSAYEYRAVTLPLQHPFLSHSLSPHADAIRRERRRLPEKVWRALGIRMSCGWRHWGWSMYEPNILFFARPKWTDGVTGIPPRSAAFAAKRHDRMRELLAQAVAKGMNVVSQKLRSALLATQDCCLMTDTEDDESSSSICGVYQDCMR
ncbi:UNVERIFIED_CONTAM: cyclin-dependent kinase regulatory subunit protein [Hammondia hammondi]|eukprot:XP_008889456.1 cyclin-dependent kinase regulatory subunit protein [Hammondia hammondi]